MPVLAVAAHSARMMAEAARREGYDVVALDLFGDADTRRAAFAFVPIGDARALRVDASRLLAGLHQLARRGDVIGWVAGAGFEGRAELLDAGAAVLPLIGDPGSGVRDPRRFFDVLAAHGIGHPPTLFSAPTDGAGWLVKDAHGLGGWHIRRAPICSGEPLPPHHYAQREVAGVAMSATFVANGARAAVLGFNQLIVGDVLGRPFVFKGVVGRVPVSEGVAGQVRDALAALVPAFALRGLCSLDFMADGASIQVLEVNARPPASMQAYAGLKPMTLHLRACATGELPEAITPSAHVHGHRIVFARRAFTLDDTHAAMLAGRPDAHDLPHADTPFEPGDPVCSLSADAPDAATAATLLERHRVELLNTLETTR